MWLYKSGFEFVPRQCRKKKAPAKPAQPAKPAKPSRPTPAPSSKVPKRKPVWRVIGSSSSEDTKEPPARHGQLDVNDPSTANEDNDPSGAVRNGWYHDRYDPELITGYDSSCSVCGGQDYIEV